MKKVLYLFLILMFFNFYLFLNAYEPYETPDGKVVLVDFTKPVLWEVPGASKITFDEKTPDGEIAITYEVEEEGKKSIFRPKKYFDGGGKWREKKFKGVSFWVKGDGSGSYIQLRLLTEENNQLITFQYQFYLTGAEWEHKRVLWDKFTNAEGKKIDTSKIKGVYFRSTKKMKISIGPVKLEPEEGSSVNLPLLEIPSALAFFTDKPPIIDGKPNESCWSLAKEYELPYILNSNVSPKEKTKFRILYDDNNLYFSALLESKDTSKLKTTRERDSYDIYLDDCLELFFNSSKDMATYTHFMVNSKGYKGTIKRYYDKVLDAIATDTKWIGKWEVKCFLEPDKWYIEGAIPLSEIDIRKKMYGESIFFQIGRENHILSEYSSFSMTRNFPEIRNYGILSFVPPGSKLLKLENTYLEKIAPGKFKVEGMLFSDTGEKSYEILGEIISPDGKIFSNKINLSSDKGPFFLTIDYPSECEGEHRINIKGISTTGIVWSSFKFQNFLPETTQYGDIVINPTPKKVQWIEGDLTLDSSYKIYVGNDASERTIKTAKFLTEELNNYWGVKFQVEKDNVSYSTFPVILVVNPKFSPTLYKEKMFLDLTNEVKDLSKEGYALYVDNKGVIIIGKDEPGLYYGVITLMQIVKSILLKGKILSIKKCKIIDYPDVQYRFCNESPIWWRKKLDKDKVMNFYKDYVKNVIAGQKFNMLSFNIFNQVILSNKDLQVRASFITKEQYLELAEFCKEHFVEFIPALETGGHFNWVPKDKFPQFFEEGFARQANVTHPDFYNFIFSIMEDLIPPGCKYFNLCHDEWWSNPPADATDKLNGVPRKEIFLKYVKDQHKWLKDRGIRALMYGDMLLKNHNGDVPGPKKGIYEVANMLPKDIIILNWSSRVDPSSNKFFYNLGYEVICTNNGFRPYPSDRNILSGFGILCYGWSFLTSKSINSEIDLNYGYTAVLRTADYAWNIKNDTGFPVSEFERLKGKNLIAINSLKPNPVRSSDFKILSLKKYVNSNLKNIAEIEIKIPSGKSEFGFIPMEILNPNENQGKYLVALTNQEKSIEIEFNEKFSSIYFLHGCYLPKESRAKFFDRYKDFIFGIPVAYYLINYEDDTQNKIEARFGLNILEICPPNPRSRYMSEIRYFWEGRTDKEEFVFLYQYEWVNPNPDKKVKSITLQTANTEAIPLIFAVTTCGVRR